MALPFNPIYFMLHIDQYLGSFISAYGPFTYIILFLIIFAETGLVIAPFLPGDSLLFVSGIFAVQGAISILWLFVILSIAAILGDNVNYLIGKYLGKHLFANHKIIKEKNIARTKEFFEKYGGITIVYARFIPIIRTFAPFVAGVSKMNYRKFLFFNIIGGIAWVALFLGAGFFLGNVPLVKENLTAIIFIIIFISILPLVIRYLRNTHNVKRR